MIENQEFRNESAKKAEFNSTIVQFYEQCCKSADVKRPWHTLHPHVQMQFSAAASYIHNVVLHGG
jgi:hypothetical protein